MSQSRNQKKKAAPPAAAKPDTEVSLAAVAAAVATDAPPPVDETAIEEAVAAEGDPHPAKVPAGDDAASTPIQTIKEDTMADTTNHEAEKMTRTTADMAATAQERMKAVYGKGTEMTSEAVEFGKGNVEAFVESSRILVSGLQDLGRTYADEARTAAETMQDDMRKLTSAKSPTEMLQLQGEIARRNFDAMVATASRSTEAMIKLANEAFAPVSNRMSLAADKVARAA